MVAKVALGGFGWLLGPRASSTVHHTAPLAATRGCARRRLSMSQRCAHCRLPLLAGQMSFCPWTCRHMHHMRCFRLAGRSSLVEACPACGCTEKSFEATGLAASTPSGPPACPQNIVPLCCQRVVVRPSPDTPPDERMIWMPQFSHADGKFIPQYHCISCEKFVGVTASFFGPKRI